MNLFVTAGQTIDYVGALALLSSLPDVDWLRGYQNYLPSLLASLKGVLAGQMAAEHRKITGSNLAVRALFASEDKTIPSPTARNLFDEWNQNKVSREISGAGHAVTYTHAQEIMAAVDDFL